MCVCVCVCVFDCVSLLQSWLGQVDPQLPVQSTTCGVQWEVRHVRQVIESADIWKWGFQYNIRLVLLTLALWGQHSSGGLVTTLLDWRSEVRFPEKAEGITLLGARDGAVGWGTALHAGRSRVPFRMVSLHFFIAIILPAALWPWGRISLYQKWVPGLFPGGKGGRCVGLTNLLLSCADCLEIWKPQPPRTIRACPDM
jgi:hypothetical protein